MGGIPPAGSSAIRLLNCVLDQHSMEWVEMGDHMFAYERPGSGREYRIRAKNLIAIATTAEKEMTPR